MGFTITLINTVTMIFVKVGFTVNTRSTKTHFERNEFGRQPAQRPALFPAQACTRRTRGVNLYNPTPSSFKQK